MGNPSTENLTNFMDKLDEALTAAGVNEQDPDNKKCRGSSEDDISYNNYQWNLFDTGGAVIADYYKAVDVAINAATVGAGGPSLSYYALEVESDGFKLAPDGGWFG
jgi:hypothetical protein